MMALSVNATDIVLLTSADNTPSARAYLTFQEATEGRCRYSGWVDGDHIRLRKEACINDQVQISEQDVDYQFKVNWFPLRAGMRFSFTEEDKVKNNN